MTVFFCFAFFIASLAGCAQTEPSAIMEPVPEEEAAVAKETVEVVPQTEPEAVSCYEPSGATLEERILPPEGFTRTSAEEGSLAEFLRSYPLKPHGTSVKLFDGREKRNQNAHVAVFDMPLENADLQQCADSVMRVYAEYFHATGQTDRIRFHFTNGFLCDFDTWKTGKRVSVNGNDVAWTAAGSADDSYEALESYLHTVFTYAGTLSMTGECERISEDEIAIGDVFLKGGSPGHVCMVIDMCEDAEGRKAFLLGQGYMPAQDFHVLDNLSQNDDPWYYVNELSYPLQTPEYVFEEGSLMRPVY